MNILIIIKFIYKVTKIRKNNLEDDICLQLATEIVLMTNLTITSKCIKETTCGQNK